MNIFCPNILTIIFKYINSLLCLWHYSARQPVVTLIEDLVDCTTAKWSATDEKIESHMDNLLQLQRERLQLEREHLELKRQLAGLSKKGTLNYYIKVDLKCTDTIYLSW